MKRAPTKTDISADRVREILAYEPATGILRWKVNHRKSGIQRKGTVAGSVEGRGPGYIRVTIDDRKYMAHRLIWLYMRGEWPPALIDHKDGNSLNNKFENLRLASLVENNRNTSARGYRFDRGRYIAYVYVDGKQIILGRFRSEDHARAARHAGASQYFGEFSPTNRVSQ